MHKPMKCASLMTPDGVVHLDDVMYPKLVSPKFDGNRCYVEDGVALSSSGKPIRNLHIRKMLSDSDFNGLDGELIVGSPTAKDVRRATTSGVSRAEGEPDFTFFVFDDFRNSGCFETRLEGIPTMRYPDYIVPVEHVKVLDIAQLLVYEHEVLEQGYEGVIIRCPKAPYKQGRSTVKQNWALKLKRFLDGEAVVTGYYERQHNDNEKTTNEHGYSERSSHKENKRPAGDLGGLEVRCIKSGVEFKVGTGFDAATRQHLWLFRERLVGRLLTYKHFPIGAKDKPNLPSFVAFRDTEDMS